MSWGALRIPHHHIVSPFHSPSKTRFRKVMPFTRYLFWLFTRYILLWFYHVKNLSICSGLPYPRPEFPLSFPRVSHLRSGKVPESGSAMPRRTFTKTAVRDAAIRRPGLFKKWPSTTSIFSRSFDFIVYIIMSISHIIGDVYCMRDLRVQHVRPAFLKAQVYSQLVSWCLRLDRTRQQCYLSQTGSEVSAPASPARLGLSMDRGWWFSCVLTVDDWWLDAVGWRFR